MEQTSLIPGEEELKKLARERDELKSKVKPLLDLVKGNAQFLTKYAPFCEAVFYRSKHLVAAASNTAIAMDQADELREATIKLAECLVRYQEVEMGIELLKEQVNEATNGEYQRQHPELWGVSPEQLEEQADAILEAEGLDAETAEPAMDDDDQAVGLSVEDTNPATAI